MTKANSSSQTCYRGKGGARKHAGFTLIELMISIVIGLLLVLAMVTLLINVSRNNSELSKTNRLIENGRFTLQLLEADISHAGFWGGYIPQFDNLTVTGNPTDYPKAVPDPCLIDSSWTAAVKTNLIGIPVQGYEIPDPVPTPTLSVCASKVISPKAETDVLFVRHLEPCVPGTTNCAALTNNEFYFQQALCETVAIPSPPYAFEKYDASNVSTLFPFRNRGCNTGATGAAELRRFMSTLYYVRDYAVTAGDGIPTLMRSQFGVSVGTPEHETAEALIEGIEGFRVEYGVDSLSDTGAAVNFGAAINWANTANKTSPTNRGDGSPDGAYVRCTTALPCTVDQLANTVVVRIYVLVRNEQTTPGYIDRKSYNLGSTSLGPFNDSYKRHLFTQTIRLNNISSRRETP